MMNKIPFRLDHGLLYFPISLQHEGKDLLLNNCIFDTGSAGSTFDADLLAKINIVLSPHSRVKRLMTVGGFQYVFTRKIHLIKLGSLVLKDREIEVGDLNSQFKIDGIIGTDLMKNFDWQISFKEKHLTFNKH